MPATSLPFNLCFDLASAINVQFNIIMTIIFDVHFGACMPLEVVRLAVATTTGHSERARREGGGTGAARPAGVIALLVRRARASSLLPSSPCHRLIAPSIHPPIHLLAAAARHKHHHGEAVSANHLATVSAATCLISPTCPSLARHTRSRAGLKLAFFQLARIRRRTAEAFGSSTPTAVAHHIASRWRRSGLARHHLLPPSLPKCLLLSSNL